jgi:hypothetical protein
LKVVAQAAPAERVKQAADTLVHRIHQVVDYKRDLIIGLISQSGPKSGATKRDQEFAVNAQNTIANTFVTHLAIWANSFIDDLNENNSHSQLKKGSRAEGDDESGSPFGPLAEVSPEHFAAVAAFLQYVDAYSLEIAAEAAGYI